MALFVNFRLGNSAIATSDWKAGQRPLFSGLDVDQLDILKVVCLQASGAELTYIREVFSGIPMTEKQSTVTWTGEMALFIAMNL